MKASEAIQVLQGFIKKYGDLQIAIQDSEFFSHSPHVYFRLTERNPDDVSPYIIDTPLDKRFIAIEG